MKSYERENFGLKIDLLSLSAISHKLYAGRFFFFLHQYIKICSYPKSLRVVHGYLMSQYGLTRMLFWVRESTQPESSESERIRTGSTISGDDSAGSTGTRPSL